MYNQTTPQPTDRQSPNAHWIAIIEKQSDNRIEWMHLAGELLHLLKTPTMVVLNEPGLIQLEALKQRYIGLTMKVGQITSND